MTGTPPSPRTVELVATTGLSPPSTPSSQEEASLQKTLEDFSRCTKNRNDFQILNMWLKEDARAHVLGAYAHWGPSSIFNAAYMGEDVLPDPEAISPEAAEWISRWDQTSPQWTTLRVAFLTGTTLGKRVGLGYVNDYVGETAQGICNELFLEDTGRLVPRVFEMNQAMRWGVVNEDLDARMYNYFVHENKANMSRPNLLVCRDPGRGHFAASPDRFVGPDGIAEMKVSATTAYPTVQTYWMPQVQEQLMITKRSWCDVSMLYLPYDYEQARTDRSVLTVVRVYPSPEYWQVMEQKANAYVEAVYGCKEMLGFGDFDKSKVSLPGVPPVLSPLNMPAVRTHIVTVACLAHSRYFSRR